MSKSSSQIPDNKKAAAFLMLKPRLSRPQKYGLWALIFSFFVHVLIFALTFLKWPWKVEGSLSSPPEIPVEIVMEKQPAAEVPVQSEPQQQVLRQSGPDEEGNDRPKSQDAVPSPSEITPVKPETSPTPPTAPPPGAGTTKPQAQAMRPRPSTPQVTIPIPLPSQLPGDFEQQLSALLGVAQPHFSMPSVGRGLGDAWMNSVKARIGPVENILNSDSTVTSVATYRIIVDGYGRILSVGVVTSCGKPALDEQVMSAIRKASPVPPPPRGVTVPAELFLQITKT